MRSLQSHGCRAPTQSACDGRATSLLTKLGRCFGGVRRLVGELEKANIVIGAPTMLWTVKVDLHEEYVTHRLSPTALFAQHPGKLLKIDFEVDAGLFKPKPPVARANKGAIRHAIGVYLPQDGLSAV